MAFEPLAADLDINEGLDFLYFNSDGSLDREDLEDDFLESFLLPARIPQRVHFLGRSILTTFHLGLGSLPAAGQARLLNKARTIFYIFHDFQVIPGVGGAAFGPRAPPLCPWSHYVPLFRRGQAFPGQVQNTWAEVLLSYPFFDRLEVLTRALVVTFDLARTSSSAFDLECSRSFATLFLPQLSTIIDILERVASPPFPSLPTTIKFGPLTAEDHEAALPPPSIVALPPLVPPSSAFPPHALTPCRHAGGMRHRFAKCLAIAPLSLHPCGASTFYTQGTRVHFILSPPPFHWSPLGVLGFVAAFAAEPKEPL